MSAPDRAVHDDVAAIAADDTLDDDHKTVCAAVSGFTDAGRRDVQLDDEQTIALASVALASRARGGTLHTVAADASRLSVDDLGGGLR